MNLPSFGLNTLRMAALAALVMVAGCFEQGASGTVPEDMVMGDPKAPITITEYASVACPHCAKFNNDVFPAFKKKYIDTGKVFYVTREMLTGEPSVAAAGFLVARCAGKDKYFTVTDAVYHSQQEMFADGTTRNVRPVLLRIAKSAGLSETQFDKCVSDEGALNAIRARSDKYGDRDHIEGTPSFVVKGKVVAASEVTLADMDKIVADAQAGK